MTKEQSYINKGTTLKELIYNAAGEFPNNNAFRFKEKGVIKTESFSQLIRDIEAMGTAMFTRNFDGKNIGILSSGICVILLLSAEETLQFHLIRDLQPGNWRIV